MPSCSRALPKGAFVVNIGRGAHLVDADLLASLDSAGNWPARLWTCSGRSRCRPSIRSGCIRAS